MSLLCKVGSFNITTQAAGNTVTVSGVGFTPKVVLFWWNVLDTADDNTTSTDNGIKGFGYMASSTARGCVTAQSEDASGLADCDRMARSDACIATLTIAGAVNGLADFSSFNSDGFVVIIDDNFSAENIRVCYMALGGDDITDVAGGTFQEPEQTGVQTYTTNFQPDVVFMFSGGSSETTVNADSLLCIGCAVRNGLNDMVVSGNSNNGSDPTITKRYGLLGECIALYNNNNSGLDGRATINSFTSTGFTLNWLARGGTRIVVYVAIKGGSWIIGDLQTLTNTTTDIVESGFGFSPRGALFLSIGTTATAVNTPVDIDALCIGAFDSATSRVAINYNDLNGAATTDIIQAIEHDEVFAEFSAESARMDIKSVDQDGFTCIMDVAAGATDDVFYVAFGDSPSLGQPTMKRWGGVPNMVGNYHRRGRSW